MEKFKRGFKAVWEHGLRTIFGVVVGTLLVGQLHLSAPMAAAGVQASQAAIDSAVSP